MGTKAFFYCIFDDKYCVSLGFFDFFDIVRSVLINDIIQPVGEKQVGMSAPSYQRRLGSVVVGEIVLGHLDGFSLR